MHAIEKILARAAGKEVVQAGEIINAEVDITMIHDRAGPRVMELLKQNNTPWVNIPEKVAVFFDHDVSPTKIGSATKQHEWRIFMEEQNITKIFDIGSGVSHIVMPRKGLIEPGALMVGTDSHSCTGGALGAVATGIGETEMASVLLTGKLWFKIPKIVNIIFTGNLNVGVGPKDISLYLLKNLGTDSLIYTAVEFSGQGVSDLSMSDRMALTSMSIQMGAKFAYIAPDEKTLQFCKESGVLRSRPVFTDDDYVYKDIINVDLKEVEPLIALPHGFDEIIPVKKVPKVPIDQTVIGSCTGGRLEDLRIAAAILEGKKVSSGTRLIVTLGSREIYLSALEEGLISILVEAGASINPPRCGPCGSACDGLLGPNEVCLTNANRNFKGRLGSPDAKIYLASTAAVATSAAAGYITAPSKEDLEKLSNI
jgi:3-isopropylmalate/(R)-2-methylmalate dehydratase large subunit